MWDEIAGAYGSRFLLAAGGVGIALLLLIGILWILRSRAPSPFVRGGKNRQPRLQVLDAAAVDARRRLVLVRRDGIEHLIMIGGPTDIVIESGISDPSKAAAQTPIPVELPAAQELPRLERQPPEPAEARIEAYLNAEPTIAIEPIIARPQPVAAQPPRAQQAAAAVLSEAEAAEILDAARHVVLPPEPPRPASAAPVVAAPQAREPGSDFQRVLEAEMANNLTAERIIPNAQPQQQIQQQPAIAPAQRRDPELAPVTGSDAALQKEVARIFGEMSVNRDK
ncbi:flagellar biosynthesis protein FliO [Rhizobium lusitanum]|uniref:flagellar biosynthetic protein FliO n=1 Tax=Rhizobium lusitanum TaxID=293958 RepID=UPI00161A252B|nr:flagellar biosynthetic protein FliO [Rhizobium lusitanum]QND47327.1 flagellar biosynthesis protein FliO [Rhizobium lusitanum]